MTVNSRLERSPDSVDSLNLLRQYEPIVRYTFGEHFYPMDVESYVNRCALWVQPPRAPAEEIIPHGELSLDRLGSLPADDPQGVYFLQFVKAMSAREQRRFRSQVDRPYFKARGRLVRVGLLPRLIDALFTVTLWMRGTVPGGTALAAERAYRALRSADPRNVYYGRVLRQNGYLVLHYLYFYCMNDWRSSFFGVNDHEADWEQVFVYLETLDDGANRPVWVGYASHDYDGDDLRRHWNDPELEKVGTHPVVYAGAGSHAGYFRRGEYLVTVSLSPFRHVISLLERLQRFWRFTLRQGDPDAQTVNIADVFRIPFVDYARGDGVSIGPDPTASPQMAWTPVLLDPDAGWVKDYRGLWGLFARDPVSGENAPAGPKFNRDGTVRRSWHNPLGWSGLEKVKPPHKLAGALEERIAQLRAEQREERAAADRQHELLTRLYIEYQALADQPHLKPLYQQAWVDVQQAEGRLNELRDRIATRAEIVQVCEDELAALRAGKSVALRAHIRRANVPESEEDVRLSGLAESWAAFSVGLLLIGFVVLVLTSDRWVAGLGAMLTVFALLDAIFRGHFEELTLRATLGLAMFATLVLVYEFFWTIAGIGVTAVGLLIIMDNLRELRA